MPTTTLLRSTETAPRETERPADAGSLWQEHGWALRGWHVAVLVGAVIAVSLAMRLFV